jgi:hypothetical protein
LQFITISPIYHPLLISGSSCKKRFKSRAQHVNNKIICLANGWMLQCHSVIKTTENFERGGGKRRRRGIKRGKLDKLITGYTMVNKRLSKHKPDKIQRREQVEPLRFRG